MHVECLTDAKRRVVKWYYPLDDARPLREESVIHITMSTRRIKEIRLYNNLIILQETYKVQYCNKTALKCCALIQSKIKKTKVNSRKIDKKLHHYILGLQKITNNNINQ